MYHYLGVPPARPDPHRGLHVPPDEFRRQLAALTAMGRESLSPESYCDRLKTNTLGRAVWLTFDDGKRDNHEHGLPALTESRHRATFFVVVEKCLAGDPQYMTVSMLRELVAAGMSIGSHTLTHPRLARIPADQMRREVIDSRKRLEDTLGVAVTSFCYPYGNLNGEVIGAVRDAGYDLAVSTVRDNRNTWADRWKLSRAMVQPGRVGWKFRYTFSPLYHWVHAAKNRRRWNAEGGLET